MSKLMSNLWRVMLLPAGVFILLGGPRHPHGTMAEMLSHPDWIPSHVLVLAGFVSMLAGLILYGRISVLPDNTRKWLRIATYGTAFQTLEMLLHTMAFVDYENLVAGNATPVLTTHLVMAVVAYPVFGATLIGLIVAGARERVLGSVWIAWIGVVGALGHGLAAPLTILLDAEWPRVLFPLVALVAAWMALVAFWPSQASRSNSDETFVQAVRT